MCQPFTHGWYLYSSRFPGFSAHFFFFWGIFKTFQILLSSILNSNLELILLYFELLLLSLFIIISLYVSHLFLHPFPKMCHKEAKYYLCGHRALINTMYCSSAIKTGSFCRNPKLKPYPSSPINSPCQSCQSHYESRGGMVKTVQMSSKAAS